MNNIFELDFYGRNIKVEIGEYAKQTNGSCLVRYGDTAVITAAVMSKNAITADFFPLTVSYQERLYSVGKIPGGFIKREGKPTEAATLASRLIDRTLRPLFAEGFRNEVQVISTILSVDQDNSPEMTAMLASSIALSISDIPFEGPIAGVVVGRVDGEFIINPTSEQLEKTDIVLTVAGTKDAINMVEAGCHEVNEEDMVEALMFGHEAIKKLIAFEEEIVKKIGKEKIEVVLAAFDSDLESKVREFASSKMKSAIQIKEKLEKYAAIDKVKEDTILYINEEYKDSEELEKMVADASKIVDIIEGEEVRNMITIDKIRPDGRKMDEIRPLSCDIDLLARTHGSAIFTRGQTQVLATTTLGALGEHQILDGLGIEEEKRFMLHYNFPAFSVGETGRYGSPGRREIGHGALGERALLQVMPSEEEFPYTVRVVTEVLESNGSSSQASICSGCLSLMAAGVPIKAPVAGIAMGLITKDDKYTILTDIQGLEDHMGDMDFKVAGTRKGICALQMDIKIKGVTKEILAEALEQAKKARMQILDVMGNVISEPRKELSPYAPKIETFTINPEKIKDVIGRGGEMITKIILEASNVKTVNDKDVIYDAKVVKVEDFGCFAEIWPGCEGSIHVSQLALEHVNKPSDVVKVGDIIKVKSMGYDKKGRLNLSHKEVLKETTEK